MARDNFTTKTIEVLAKRVGFHCSNPECGVHTVGPNTDPERVTVIGIAAHITAASIGGPRYDVTLTGSERKHINNGIWLCSNCATLIDKDSQAYSVALLKEWKSIAESKMCKIINENVEKEIANKISPYIEADLIWTGSARFNRGFSIKNKEIYKEPISAGMSLYIYWDLVWDFRFVIYNNSSVPAFNLQIEPFGDKKFSNIPALNKVNNIPPYENIDFETQYERRLIEATNEEADAILGERIPPELNGIELKVSYHDEARNEHITIVKIENGIIVNEKIK